MYLKNGLLILSMLMLVASPLASACSITLNPDEGLMTMVSGEGYIPSATIKIYWDGTEMKTIPTKIIVDSVGRFTALVVALNQNQGEYVITALTGSATFTVPNLRGEQGEDGLNGLNGADGLDGINGTQGERGLRGYTGEDGKQGIQGIKGDTGLIGLTGMMGLAGINGLSGELGERGEKGIQGIQGLSGDTGAKGVDGQNGKDANELLVMVALTLGLASVFGVGYILWFRKT